MKIRTSSRQAGDDELVPLINVVFLLLIFFLIAGTLTPAPAVPIRYLESDGAAVPTLPPGSVFVDASGRFFVDGAEVPAENLTERLGNDGRVSLVLDRGVQMRRLDPLFRALTHAGSVELEIVTVRGSPR